MLGNISEKLFCSAARLRPSRPRAQAWSGCATASQAADRMYVGDAHETSVALRRTGWGI